ncbi:MAG: amidohydrolase family protein, partial [Prolixibacteraceae bacterium]|nr:amidohydrolase family protein [Prolixibacteraceae bacterium]
KAPDLLERAVENGALGLKNFKDLGLTVTDNNGKLVKIDDPRLMPIWEKAQQLNTVVAFHTTDPVAFFEPWTPENERWEELELHPNWSFADRSKYPERNSVLEQRNNVIKSFKEITFHCAHVANNSENLNVLDEWMDEMPNIVVDLSARFGELGRHPAADGFRFFEKHQERIMFGTDRMFWKDGEVQGAGPSKIFTKEEDNKFYQSHWRYLQTTDKQFDHPTPIQGNWKINGIGLPEEILKKIYWDNAYKLYNLKQFGVR